MDTTPHIYSVSELNGLIRNMLEGAFPFICVQGEISNLHTPYSGHSYFTLKDNKAQLTSVLFKLQKRYLETALADGQHVICRGRLTVYEPRGDYQLIVDTVSFLGAGSLQQAFEQLKQKLSREGLFDPLRKKAIPTSPEHITLITSPRGAAVHDFIQIATRRAPSLHLLVYPVSVQGSQAPAEIIQAIQMVNKEVATDVIVLCRGGGSIEDLWAFNDEQLAREICRSRLPVVSAIGHEIDFTIADFAADLRAPTPSGAAELIVPDNSTRQLQLRELQKRIEQSMRGRLSDYSHRLRYGEQALSKMTYPLEHQLLRLGQLSLQMERSLENLLSVKAEQIRQLSGRIDKRNPMALLKLHRQQVAHGNYRLQRAMCGVLHQKSQTMVKVSSLLDGVSPLATLARGYAIVRKKKTPHSIITDPDQVVSGEELDILVSKGTLLVSVTGTSDRE
ncbi:MAG: exodeoxyribonuclease VII large subunit [Desulfobulbus propionicus]|nr:MAG: exodeoxyribonuclease VII large subunit [Desulfobulbus propionicus]